MPYDPVGAMGGLFAPAYIVGNPESEAAVAQWQATNHPLTPDMIEQTRGPSTTTTAPNTMGLRAGTVTTTTPGTVDPAALKVLAQGGKYDMNTRRNEIAAQIMATPAASAPATSVPAVGPIGGLRQGVRMPPPQLNFSRVR